MVGNSGESLRGARFREGAQRGSEQQLFLADLEVFRCFNNG